ncbi:NAD(P)-binding domain-containing protein, partial [Pseudomonas aeruginosa]
MTVRLVVVGGGRMGEALVCGVLAARWARPNQVAVVEPVEERRRALAAAHPGLRVGTDVPRRA